ncbi:hypothetical protein [Deefgea sp. CFH1-16]|uniref:hypothetical protein n=1 Tax=Deefgea sp. CFH1-16 TaxID=2675457 RepID=UPI0015F54F00|nr:hypothetical protein [Deefgea sp. CFH1-16]
MASWNKQKIQLALWDAATPLPAALSTMDLRASFDLLGETLWALACRASQIATFLSHASLLRSVWCANLGT